MGAPLKLMQCWNKAKKAVCFRWYIEDMTAPEKSESEKEIVREEVYSKVHKVGEFPSLYL